MLGQIMEQAGISILVGCVCLYFAYRVMILKDIKAIRGKGKPDPEDKEGYCRDTGSCSCSGKRSMKSTSEAEEQCNE